MREKRFSATQRTVLNMLLLDPPTCAAEIKAAAEYLSVLTNYIKEQTEVYKLVWSEKDLVLVEDLSESLISTATQSGKHDQRDILFTTTQLAFIHPSLVACMGDEIK
jgi:hypothetical protein